MKEQNRVILISCTEKMRSVILDHAEKFGMKITEWIDVAIIEKAKRDKTERGGPR